jgi:hypothetical protein
MVSLMVLMPDVAEDAVQLLDEIGLVKLELMAREVKISRRSARASMSPTTSKACRPRRP